MKIGEKTRYPSYRGYYVMHDVSDQEKSLSMRETLKSGGLLPSIAVYGKVAVEGVHRMAAYTCEELEPVTHQVSHEKALSILLPG